MKNRINFSEINIELGQTKLGLSRSSEYLKAILPNYDVHFELIDNSNSELKNPSGEYIQFKFDNEFKKVSWSDYESTYQHTLKLLNTEMPLLNWGGDHSISLSTVGAFIEKHNGYVLWIDAHADLNLPSTSPSGSLHGMPLSILLNLNGLRSKYFPWIKHSLAAEKLIYLGLRSIDPFEQTALSSLGIQHYFYSDVKQKGLLNIIKEIKSKIQNTPLHVSFDIDSMDPKFAPSTGVPVKNGFTPFEIDLIAENLIAESDLKSMDIVELNPMIGNASQVERTFMTAIEFINSSFKYNNEGDIVYGLQSSSSSIERYLQHLPL
jgi:arginase